MRIVMWCAMVVLAGCAGPAAPDDVEEPVSQPEPRAAPVVRAEPEVDREELNVTTVTKAYTGPSLGPFALNTGCDDLLDPGGPENVGGACFMLPPGTHEVEFKAVDDVAPDVGLYVRYDGGSEGFFCSKGTVRVGSTDWLMIVASESACLVQGSPAAPTTGELHVTIYHDSPA